MRRGAAFLTLFFPLLCKGVTFGATTAVTCGSGVFVYPTARCRLWVSSLPADSDSGDTLMTYRTGAWRLVTGSWNVTASTTAAEYNNGIAITSDILVEIVHTLPFACGSGTTTGILVGTVDVCSAVLSPGRMALPGMYTEPYNVFWSAPTHIATSTTDVVDDVYVRHVADIHRTGDEQPTVLWYKSPSTLRVIGVELETPTRGAISRVHRGFGDDIPKGCDNRTTVPLAIHRPMLWPTTAGRPIGVPIAPIEPKQNEVCGYHRSPELCWSMINPYFTMLKPLERRARQIPAPDNTTEKWYLLRHFPDTDWTPRLASSASTDSVDGSVGVCGGTYAVVVGEHGELYVNDFHVFGGSGSQIVASSVHQIGMHSVGVVYVDGVQSAWTPSGTIVIVNTVTGAMEEHDFELNGVVQTSRDPVAMAAYLNETTMAVGVCGSHGMYTGTIQEDQTVVSLVASTETCRAMDVVWHDDWVRASWTPGTPYNTTVCVIGLVPPTAAPARFVGLLETEVVVADGASILGTYSGAPSVHNATMAAWVTASDDGGLPVDTVSCVVRIVGNTLLVGVSNGSSMRWTTHKDAVAKKPSRAVSSPLVAMVVGDSTRMLDLSEGHCFYDSPPETLLVDFYGTPTARPSPPPSTIVGCGLIYSSEASRYGRVLGSGTPHVSAAAGEDEPTTMLNRTVTYRHTGTRYTEDHAERRMHVVPINTSRVLQCASVPTRTYHDPAAFSAHYALGSYCVPTSAPTSAPTATGITTAAPTFAPTFYPTSAAPTATGITTATPTTAAPTSAIPVDPTGCIRATMCTKMEDQDTALTSNADRTCVSADYVHRSPGIYVDGTPYSIEGNNYVWDFGNHTPDTYVGTVNTTGLPPNTDSALIAEYHDGNPKGRALHTPSVHDYDAVVSTGVTRHLLAGVPPVRGVPRVYVVDPCDNYPYTSVPCTPSSSPIVVQPPRQACPSKVGYMAGDTCTPLRVCAPGYEYETTPPGPFSDRECTATTSCGNTAFESVVATATSDRNCTAYTMCNPITHYVSIGATPSSDRGCAARTTECSPGYYYTRQPDADPGTVKYSEACTKCPAGTTSWHSEGALGNTVTECRAVSELTEDEIPCLGGGVDYFSAAHHALDTTRNTSEACRYCTVCGPPYFTTAECTLTSNSVCTNSAILESEVGDPSPMQCNPGYYLNVIGENLFECEACTKCETYESACTFDTDALCAPNSMAALARNLILILEGGYVLAVLLYYVALPVVIARYKLKNA